MGKEAIGALQELTNYNRFGRACAAFGGDPREDGMVGSRAVRVLDPEGRIAGVIPRFLQMDPTAYEGLAEIIDGAMPEPEPGN